VFFRRTLAAVPSKKCVGTLRPKVIRVLIDTVEVGRGRAEPGPPPSWVVAVWLGRAAGRLGLALAHLDGRLGWRWGGLCARLWAGVALAAFHLAFGGGFWGKYRFCNARLALLLR